MCYKKIALKNSIKNLNQSNSIQNFTCNAEVEDIESNLESLRKTLTDSSSGNLFLAIALT